MRFWMIIAGVCVAVTAMLLWLRHGDAAFVVATFGVVAWFMNYRMRLKELLASADVKERDDTVQQRRDQS